MPHLPVSRQSESRLSLLPALCLAALLAAGPARAQTYEPPPADGEPPSAFEQGLENFMRNLLDRAMPQLDQLGRDLGGLTERLGPLMGEIGALMDDVGNYQAPERLENGDILIRRRADAPPPPPIGPNLRDMLRPPPGTPEPGTPGPDAPIPLPERDPTQEITL